MNRKQKSDRQEGQLAFIWEMKWWKVVTILEVNEVYWDGNFGFFFFFFFTNFENFKYIIRILH
jgi:hypothetical protein